MLNRIIASQKPVAFSALPVNASVFATSDSLGFASTPSYAKSFRSDKIKLTRLRKLHFKFYDNITRLRPRLILFVKILYPHFRNAPLFYVPLHKIFSAFLHQIILSVAF